MKTSLKYTLLTFIPFYFRIFCFCLTLQLVTANTSYSEWLSMTRRTERRERRTHGKNNLMAAPENLSTPAATKECCKNGGLCIMNSFCHCKKPFYGRYCQHRVRHQSCGTVAHGTWLTAACNLCHCYDGQMVCKVYQFPGCGETFQNGVEEDPDYSGGIEKVFDDYEQFYDNFVEDYPSSSAASSSEGMYTSILTLSILTCWAFTGLYS